MNRTFAVPGLGVLCAVRWLAQRVEARQAAVPARAAVAAARAEAPARRFSRQTRSICC